MDIKEKLQDIEFSLEHRHTNPRLLLAMGAIAAIMIIVGLWLAGLDFFNGRAANNARQQGGQALSLVTGSVQSLQGVLNDDRIQNLAARAIEDPDTTGALEKYLSERISEIREIRLFGPALDQIDPVDIGPNGFAIMDMLLTASMGRNAPLQIHHNIKPPMMFDAVQIGTSEQPLGYLLVSIEPGFVLSGFNPGASGAGFIRLTQYNGRQAASVLREAGDPATLGSQPEIRAVTGSRFRVEYPQHVFTEFISTGHPAVHPVCGRHDAGGRSFPLSKQCAVAGHAGEKEIAGGVRAPARPGRSHQDCQNRSGTRSRKIP